MKFWDYAKEQGHRLFRANHQHRLDFKKINQSTKKHIKDANQKKIEAERVDEACPVVLRKAKDYEKK